MEGQLLGGLDAQIASGPPPIADIDVVGGPDVIGLLILCQMLAEAPLGQGNVGVVLAPELVGGVELLGAGLRLREEVEIAPGGHEVHHVVALGDGGLHVGPGLVADGKAVVVCLYCQSASV